MAGITANANSKQILSGATAVDKVDSGFITGERITLGTDPVGSSYTWGLAVPSDSATAKSKLSDKTDATPTFTPDVPGEYIVTCTVDGTAYTLRFTAVNLNQVPAVHGVRLTPTSDASIPAPSQGVTLYYSADQGGLALKDSGNNVSTVDTTAV